MKTIIYKTVWESITTNPDFDPVVHPAIADDPDTAHIRTITLSYMFFDAGEEALARYVSAETAADTNLN